MDGSMKPLTEILMSQSKIIIPVYQRNYDWKLENCKRLFNDLLKLANERRQAHFFGSIVVKPGRQMGEQLVIDGQQRITTVSLLLLAVVNYLKNQDDTDLTFNSRNLASGFLLDDFSRSVDKQKLQLNLEDDKAYKKLFGDQKFFKPSNVTRNYIYFYEEVSNLDISTDVLVEAIRRLQVMVVNLNSPEDDPQLIFESLNSTGLALNEADKIRNYLLMNEELEQQEYYFKNYWYPIEKRTNYETSLFFWYYMAIKNSKYPVKANLYEDFKKYVEKSELTKQELFYDLNDYSYAYEQVINESTNDSKINQLLNRFNHINLTVINPFLMSILLDYSKKFVSNDDVIASLEIVESYLARRIFCAYSTNSLNKLFAGLYRDFKNLFLKEAVDNPNLKPHEVLSYILLNKTGTTVFPDDEEFIQNLKTRDYYRGISSEYRKYLFERLENYNHRETLPIYEGLESGEYSIEHIMPQHLSKLWKEELGSNYQEIHDIYLNNLGNLTLTAYNSEYSNLSFIEKKTMENGFEDSHFFFLNKYPRQVDRWDEAAIKERSNRMIEKALEIWSIQNPDFKPKESKKEMSIYDGETYYTGMKIKGFIFLDQAYQPVKTWKEMMTYLLRDLIDLDYNIINKIASLDVSKGWKSYLSKEEKTKFIYIKNDIYAKLNVNNWNKMNMVKHLFYLYGLNYSELQLDIYK